jgi:hypothetical protein
MRTVALRSGKGSLSPPLTNLLKSPRNPARTGTANLDRSPSATVAALTEKAARSGTEWKSPRIHGPTVNDYMSPSWVKKTLNSKENPVWTSRELHFFFSRTA